LIEILLYKQKDTNPHSQDEGRRSQVGGGSTRAEQPGLANTQHRLDRVVWRGGGGKGVSACLPNAYTSLHAGIHWEKRRLADGGRSLLQGTSISASAFGPTKKLFVSQHKDLSPAFPFPWISLSLRVCVFLGVWASQTGIFQSKLHIEFSQQPTEKLRPRANFQPQELFLFTAPVVAV